MSAVLASSEKYIHPCNYCGLNKCICCRACKYRYYTSYKHWNGSLCGRLDRSDQPSCVWVTTSGTTKIDFIDSSKRFFNKVSAEQKCPACLAHKPDAW
jgi:hypothetical protein